MALPIAWKERVDSRSPGALQLGLGETRQVLIGWTDWSNLTNFTAPKAILGWPARDPNVSPARSLRRNLPMTDPEFPWLYASKIASAVGLVPTGKVIPGGTLDPYASYDQAELTVVFETLPYDVLSDAAVSMNAIPEFFRFVEKRVAPSVENINRPGATFKWYAGPVSGTFAGGVVKRVAKADFIWVWHQVPHNGLFDVNWTLPNISPGIGMVNNDWFPLPGGGVPNAGAGFAPGTLLMMPPKITPEMAPASPTALGILTLGSPPRTWRVEYHVKYFDPPFDGTITPNPQTSLFRGHNLFPPPPNTSATTNFWYPAARNSSSLANAFATKLYDDYDFSLFFTLI